MSLTDEQMTRFEALSGLSELDDAQMTELEQLDGLSRQADAETSTPAVAATSPMTPWLTGDDISREVEAGQRDAKLAQLRTVFGWAQRSDVDTEARVLGVAKSLGVTTGFVRDNLPAWEATAEDAGWDAEAWLAKNPEWANRIFEDPSVGKLILNKRERGLLEKGLSAVREALAPLREWSTTPEAVDTSPDAVAFRQQRAAEVEAVNRQRTAEGLPLLEVPIVGPTTREEAQQQLATERTAAQEGQRAWDLESLRLRTARGVWQRETEEARQLRESGDSQLILGARLDEAQRGLEKSRKWWQYTLARNGITALGRFDAEALQREIHDLNVTGTQMDLGDNAGGALTTAGDAMSGVASTGTQLLTRLGAMGGGAATGALAGGALAAVGGAMVGGPALARQAAVEGAAAGARVGAKVGDRLGAGVNAWDLLQLEGGETAEKLYTLRTEDRKQLSDAEVLGAATVAGVLSGALEFIGFSAETAGIRGVSKELLEQGLRRDPTMRALVLRLGKQMATGTGTETLTEPTQSALKAAVAYFAASAKDGKWQAAGIDYSVEEGLQEAEAALWSSLAFGAGGAAIDAATTRIDADARRSANRAVGPILELAQSPAMVAAPEAFAATVSEATANTGHAAVTSLYVDAAEVTAYFQKEGSDGSELAGLLGPDAPQRLLEATAEDGKLEIPMSAVPAWAGSEVGKALSDAVTADAQTLSPRAEKAAKQRQESINAEVEALAADAEAQMSDAETLALRQAELEAQLRDAGFSAQEAKVAALATEFQRVQAENFGLPVAEVFPEAPVTAEQGEDFRHLDEVFLSVAEGRGIDAPFTEETAAEYLEGDEHAGRAQREAETARRAEDAAWLREGNFNAPGNIEKARKSLERMRPALNADEKQLAKTKKGRKAAEKSARARMTARRDAMAALLDFIEGKGEGIRPRGEKYGQRTGAMEVSPEVYAEAKRTLMGRFDLVDPLTGRAELEELFARQSGVSREKGAKYNYARSAYERALKSDRREAFARDVQGRSSATRTYMQSEAASASRVLTDRFNAQVNERAEERVTDFYIDTTTGALNRRAFERIEPAGRQVAVISVEGVKYQNDNLGHDAGNAVYRAAAQALAPLLPEVAKVGGDFAVYVDSQEQLDVALEQANRFAALEGYTLTGTVGANLRSAAEANNAKKKAAEAAGERARRGERPRGTPALAEGQAITPLAGRRLEGTAISEALRKRLATEFAGSPGEQFNAVFVEANTGLLTKDGFDRLPPKRFKASIDLNGIKEFNDSIGEAATDVIIEMFSRAMTEMGGARFDAAHVSGDEYLAQSDNEAELRQWLQDIYDEASKATVVMEVSEAARESLGLAPGVDLAVQGLPFGAGVGKSIDDAEQELIADKERLSQRGLRGYGTAFDRVRFLERAEGDGSQDEGTAAAVPREVDDVARQDRLVRLGRESQRFLREVTRLEQKDGDAKGYSLVPEDAASRRLQRAIRTAYNPSADVSTIIHEFGHAFLEQLGNLAERPDAPQRTKDTWADALKALGVSSRSELTVEHHERWARNWEAYSFEGKTPNPALRKLYQRFTQWLVSIYRTLRGIPGAALNDEFRQVFDAMMATADEVEAVRRRQGPTLSAAQLGVTQATREAQLQQEADEYTEGSHAAQLAAVKDALRVREKWWKQGVEKLTKAFASEWEELPAVRAQRLLEGELTGAQVKLDRAAVEEVIGTARVPGLRTTESGGVRPAEVAELAGYRSAGEMLANMAAVLPRGKDAWVREHAEAEMQRQHPGLLADTKRFRDMVEGGLHAATVRRLDREMKAIPHDALKVAAKQLAAGRRVWEVQGGRHGRGAALALKQQRKEAHLKAQAMAKGLFVSARNAATREALHMYLHRELVRAEKQLEAFDGLVAELKKTASRERLGKASPAYRDAVDYVLGALQLAEVRDIDGVELDAGALQQAVAQLNGDAVIIGDPDWLAPLQQALARGGSYERLTMAELGAVRDALVMLRQGARNRTTVLLDEKRVDFETVKADVLREISAVLPRRAPLQSRATATVTEKLAASVNGIDGYLLSPIDMVRDLTGDDQDTALWRAIVNPVRRAEYFEADLLRTAVAPIVQAFDDMPASVRAGLNDVIDGRALFPTHVERFVPRRRGELLALALNAGNESNMRVLTEGRGITETQVVAALDLLTKEEIDAVNAIMKSVESLREPAFALEERETGLRPQAVEGRPIDLKNGRLEGGYFPLKAEPFGSDAAAKQAGGDLAGLFDPTYTRPTTSHGHLKSRTGATYPVTLDLNVIRRHLAQVGHDVAFREPVKSVAKLVMDPDVRTALQDRLGAAKTDEFLQWLKDIAGAQGMGSNAAEDVFGWLKSNMATALLSGPSTAIGNLANIAAAFTSTKLKAKHMTAGLLELAASPVAARERAFAASGALRAMDDETVKGLQKHVASLYSGRLVRGLEWTKEMGMTAMRTIDGIVSTAVWLGAERQALAEGKSADEARRWADDILHQVQPSSSPVEKARILRDPGVIGKMAQFYGYLSVAYRAQHRLAAPLFTQDFRDASAAQKAVIAGGVAGNLFGFYVAFSVLGELLMGRGPEGGDRDDEEPDSEALKWRNWFVRKMVVAPLSTIPVVPLSGIVEGVVLGKRVNPRADPMTGALTQFVDTGKAISKAVSPDAPEGSEGKALKQFARSMGLVSGLPYRALDPTLPYLWDVTVGGREVPNAGRFIGGVLYGERDGQPANIPATIGDAFEDSAPRQ